MADAMEEVEAKEEGDHVLKVYRSKGRGQLLDELAAKRGELADCRACMVGLKDDLRTMAVTMEADMQRLLGALSAAAARDSWDGHYFCQDSPDRLQGSGSRRAAASKSFNRPTRNTKGQK